MLSPFVQAANLLNRADGQFPIHGSAKTEQHRLFVGTRNPAKLVVFDTESGKQITAVNISGDTDDVFFDQENKQIYISAGEGNIDVIRQIDADHYVTIAKIATASGARTSFFVPELHRLFLAVPHRGTQEAAIRVYEVQ